MRGRRLVAAAALAAAALVAPLATGWARAGDDRDGQHAQVQTGFQVLAATRYAALRGHKVGILANPTSVLPDLRHEVDVMHASGQVDLVAVFGPEHGFRGTAQAGGGEGKTTDPRTGLPVYDLYQKTPAQIAQTFRESGVDTVLFDIQDVGARFYTYIWTMYDSMAGAALAGVHYTVLDRPNPLGGQIVTGGVLHKELATLVGREPIAQQHGMTVGELARLFNAEFLPGEVGHGVDLSVVAVRGWTRDMRYADTGLPWVLPSPNMPTQDTATVYPGMGMFEGTNLSEGRGTTRPFELIGAPYVDDRWATALNAEHLPGVAFRETYFAPTFSKYAGQTVGGVQVYVTDPQRFDSVRTAVAMIVAAKRLYPNTFAWRFDAGDKIDPYWVDKLSGSSRLRTMVDAGATADDVAAAWQDELGAFRAMRAKYLIYGVRHGHGGTR